MERLVPTPDGRVLHVAVAGDLKGRPILVQHGSPGSCQLYGPHVSDAVDRGVCLIAYDRPGYGRSTAQPGRSVADCAADVRTIAEALGLGRIAVWGISGGGPHSLACAALLPGLVVAAASLASIAPYGAPGLDYFAGMGQENVDDIRLTLADEARARRKAEEDRRRLLALTADEMRQAFPTLLSPVDAAAQTPEAGAFLARWMHDGLAPVRPWGFEVEAIGIPVQLWHGRHDRFVPFQHGEWLAARIPDVDAHLSEEDGHVTLLQRRIPEVHAWLLEHF